MATETFDHQIKLLLIGDTGVGKTCLMLRYIDDKFSSTFITTIGIDFKFKAIAVGEKRVKLQVWDTAGQERFRTITTQYFRGAKAVMLVYDCTNRSSFENIENWARQIAEHAGDIAKVLVGNKCDKDGALVTEDEGRALAKKHGMGFQLTSAKSGQGVEDAFAECAVRGVRFDELGSRRQSDAALRIGGGAGGGSGCAC
uniref:Uncharacterized protein n=1 Tax=Bicosoecida sp. CB-2014 TaxID=1486930 RepID=A0A7S1G7C5_9STRA|mmetsp:Transcript_16909/g.59133  ORF Transcript_16909/g.59133 Transcript_16909/m.59133 type:complete len:199 (+) Transcript_16909:401-997(+)